MDCLFVRGHLFSYHENQLSDQEKNAVEEHLKSCRECSAISSGVISMNNLIQFKKSEQPNPFVHTRTFQRIGSEAEKPVAWHTHLVKRVLRPVAISLLFMIAVGSGSLIGWYIHQRTNYDVEQQNELASIRSGLSIDDFIDEGFLFPANQSK